MAAVAAEGVSWVLQMGSFGRLEGSQESEPRSREQGQRYGRCGAGGVSVFQDWVSCPISALGLAGPRTWAEIPEGCGVGSVRYLSVSGRAPGGSHLLSYLGLGGEGREDGGHPAPGGPAGSSQACLGIAPSPLQVGPRVGFLSQFDQHCPRPELEGPAACFVGIGFSSSRSSLKEGLGVPGPLLKDWPVGTLPRFKAFRLVRPREGGLQDL